MFKINGKSFSNPFKLKALALSYKQIFLDDRQELTPAGRAVLRDIISYSALLKTEDALKPTGREVALYISQAIFGRTDYYDALIREYEMSEKEEF